MKIKELLKNEYTDDGRFDKLENQEVSEKAIQAIKEWKSNGWTFCGMDEGFIELEDTQKAISIRLSDGKVGEVSLNG